MVRCMYNEKSGQSINKHVCPSQKTRIAGDYSVI